MRARNLFMDLSAVTVRQAKHISGKMSSALLSKVNNSTIPWSGNSITRGDLERPGARSALNLNLPVLPGTECETVPSEAWSAANGDNWSKSQDPSLLYTVPWSLVAGRKCRAMQGPHPWRSQLQPLRLENSFQVLQTLPGLPSLVQASGPPAAHASAPLMSSQPGRKTRWGSGYPAPCDQKPRVNPPPSPPTDPLPKTLIMGSSMVHHARLSQAVTYCYLGLVVLDIDEEIPQLQKHPSLDAVIIHVGANDIRNQTSEVLKADFKRLRNNLLDSHKRVVSGPIPSLC